MYRKLRIYCCLFFACAYTLAKSQNLIDWANPHEQRIENNSDYRLLGIVADRYYLLSVRNKNRILYTYSIDHQLIDKQDYKIFNKNRLYALQDIVTTPSDTFFFIHELSHEYKEWVMYKCDYVNGRFSDPKEIYFENYDDISKKRLQAAFDEFHKGSTSSGGMIMSADSSHVAFVNVIPTMQHNQSEAVSVVVYDDAMNEKWRATHRYDFSDKSINIKSLQLANNGIPYMLVEYQSDLKYGKGIVPLKVKNLPRKKFKIYRIDQYGILENEVNIGRGIGVVDANMIFPDPDSDDYVIAGYYADGKKNNKISGVFWCQSNPELEINNIKISALEKKISSNMTYDFSIYDMLRLDNGQVGFVSQDYRVTINNNNFNGAGINSFNNIGGRSYRYMSGDIFIPVFDTEGTLIKTNYILRRFDSDSDLYSHYALVEADNNYYIYYNTTKKAKEAKKQGFRGRIFTDMMTLSKSGSIQYNSTIISEKEDNFLFVPSLTTYNRSHSIIAGYDRSNLVLAKILLD